MNWFVELFGYQYMFNVMWVFVMVGGLCVFFFCYLMFKGWLFIGDVLFYFIVSGVVGVWMLGLFFLFGVFFFGGLVVGSMFFFN